LYNIWWWELDEDGPKSIVQEDLVIYQQFENWIADRERMKQEIEQRKAKRGNAR